MTSTGVQPQLESPPPSPPPPLISPSRAHRWIDLSLVMAVAFGGSVLGSIILAFHPVPPKYSNVRLAGGILAESTALLLFLTLLRRQGRRLQDIGLSFRWSDLPKGLGLVVGSFVSMAVVQALV